MSHNYQQPPKNPTLAAILSFLLIGLGQVYNGQVLKGIAFFLLQGLNVFLTTLVVGFIFIPVVWIVAIYDAYKTAQRINEEAMRQNLADTKPCPRCAERVMADAQVCRHCGHQFYTQIPPAPAPALPQPAASYPAPYPQPQPVAYEPAPVPPVQQARYCAECGQPVRATSRFCMHCGVALGQPHPASAANPSTANDADSWPA